MNLNQSINQWVYLSQSHTSYHQRYCFRRL